MKNGLKRLAWVIVGLIIAPIAVYSAAGLGFSSWPAFTGTLSGLDILGLTDVSDTTDSDDGSDFGITLNQLVLYLSDLFFLQTESVPIEPGDHIVYSGTSTIYIGVDTTTIATQADLASGLAAVDTSETVSGGLAYAELAVASAAAVDITTVDTWEIVDVYDVAMPSTGVTPSIANSNIPVTLEGRYFTSLDMTMAAGNDDYLFVGLCRNSETSPLSTIAPGFTTASIGASLSISGYVNLDASDELWVCAYNDTSNTDFDVLSSNFTLKLTGDQITGAPTITAVGLSGSDGKTVTVTGSEALSVGAGGSGGVDFDCTSAGNNNAATLVSGAGTVTLILELTNPVEGTDTCNMDYLQPVNGLEATSGGEDLATFSDTSVTNASSYTPATGLELSDDYSTDTHLLYTEVGSGTGFISGGVHKASGNYQYTNWMYNTGMSSTDHYVECVGQISASGILEAIVRGTAATGSATAYVVRLQDDGLAVHTCTAQALGSCTWLAQETGTPVYSTGTDMELEVRASSDTLTVYVDNVLKITKDITGGLSGDEVGCGTYSGASPNTTYIDSVVGDAL